MDITLSIESFLASNPPISPEDERLLRNGANSEILRRLSELALQPSLTDLVFQKFQSLAMQICARWIDFTDLLNVIPAVGRVLQFLPHLAEVAQKILARPRQDLDLLGTTPEIETLLGVWRLLEFDCEVFSKFIRPASAVRLLSNGNKPVRCLATRIMCKYMNMSDASLEALKSRYIGSEAATGTWEGTLIDYRLLPLWEQRRKDGFLNAMRSVESQNASKKLSSPPRIMQQDDLSPYVFATNGVLLLRSHVSCSEQPSAKASGSLVETPSVCENLRMFATALLHSDPILLAGPAGCGKSTLIDYLASALHKSDSMISLHLNEQSDMRSLIGIYTNEGQGSFKWQPGVVTAAVTEGRWLVIEDLDRAPKEIMSVLLPLMERRELSITSRGEVIKADVGFRIIATVRTHSDSSLAAYLHPKALGRRLWRLVNLQPLLHHELKRIVLHRFPTLVDVFDQMLATFDRVSEEMSGRGHAAKLTQFSTRPISSRQFLNWSCRTFRLFGSVQSTKQIPGLPSDISEYMFLDAIDCFLGHYPSNPYLGRAVDCIAEELHIDPSKKTFLLKHRSIQLNQNLNKGSISLNIGRARVIQSLHERPPVRPPEKDFFSPRNRYSLSLLEKVAACVQNSEPSLLVGETGIGKTASVQYLSQNLGKQLFVVNMSQQSEVGDLLGGFKPINIRRAFVSLQDQFHELFGSMFSSKKNQQYMDLLTTSFRKEHWKRVIKLWKEALKMVERSREQSNGTTLQDSHHGEAQPAKRRKTDVLDKAAWINFEKDVAKLEQQLSSNAKAFTFQYVEGNLVKAVRNGDWVLLDEINLASSDVLETIVDLLESNRDVGPSILLAESGDVTRIEAHPDFRIFAAMNPSNDVGKKDLPVAIRSRFTELFIQSPDQDFDSLKIIVGTYLESFGISGVDTGLSSTITHLYQSIIQQAADRGLVDGSGQQPQYSLRTLTRSLDFAVRIQRLCGLRRALYDGFCMCFLTCLNVESERVLESLLQERIFGSAKAARSELKRSWRCPGDESKYVPVIFMDTIKTPSLKSHGPSAEETLWIRKGAEKPTVPESYILTPYIKRNIRNLARAVFTRKYPILIQGPTSAGKTSMIEYLAKTSGNTFVRINNHEYTDLQEYFGSYVSTPDGRLVFQDGILVKAVREGHWLVLDELNLAPSDVLEALNRLLDDNREIMVPETQEVIRAHPDFVLFATQNPAGPYGGRKPLSRAFRNRFVELHFDDIPTEELNQILAKRCHLPESWCKLILETYKQLSKLRSQQRVFEQESFATLRDLFRWAFREASTVEQLAENGFMLLAEKVREQDERVAVKEIVERVFSKKGHKIAINEDHIYSMQNIPAVASAGSNSESAVVWTKAMRRLYTLIERAVANNEPVLLVGETGCGKTSVCQALAQFKGVKLSIVNAHQNTETGDIIGSQRPVRNRSAIEGQLVQDVLEYLGSLGTGVPEASQASSDIEKLLQIFDSNCDTSSNDSLSLRQRIDNNRRRLKALFEWQDGSLVHAMRSGHYYLLDEISLADDAVLERLNSVLDPGRSILLAEKGSADVSVTANIKFRFLATMNPGGDFGKKELSPALRNRFTEIWVPPLSEAADVLPVIEAKLPARLAQLGMPIYEFARWYNERYNSHKNTTISIRDILSWTQFINSYSPPSIQSVAHGGAMVYIDTIGANPSAIVAVAGQDIHAERKICFERLGQLINSDLSSFAGFLEDWIPSEFADSRLQNGSSNSNHATGAFTLESPTTRSNAMRLVRAMQVSKPILLEGSPGVGKTSLVTEVARILGQRLTRINLSDQTDLMDLFGSDVPAEDGTLGTFVWKDAPFLTALKNGYWVLLDEMNLASQSILEGLNACLDHRAEVYIPELDQVFPRHPNFRLFAAQNPHSQGGGRKGLPASFVNRFTVVFADELTQEDYVTICTNIFTNLSQDVIGKTVDFVRELNLQTSLKKIASEGSPWEINLRDIVRYLQLLNRDDGLLSVGNARDYLDIIFSLKFRSQSDTNAVQKIFYSAFGKMSKNRNMYLSMTPHVVQLGLGCLKRRESIKGYISGLKFPSMQALPVLEAMMICVQQSWPIILTGTSGSGKSCAISTLACLVGAETQILPVNAETDANDLVGGYEQRDPTRATRAVIKCLLRMLDFKLESGLLDPSSRLALSELSKAIDMLRTTQWGGGDSWIAQTETVIEILGRLSLGSEIERQLTRLQTLLRSCESETSAAFEWVDGLLVKALQEGSWLVLDNANLCSASVLDRLNSLLEPDGALIMSEHSNDDGSARLIKPHPEFRVFLTVDPAHGELSRAMRNRAVELYVSNTESGHHSSQTDRCRVPLDAEAELLSLSTVMNLCKRSETERPTIDTIKLGLNALTAKDARHADSIVELFQSSVSRERYPDIVDEISLVLRSANYCEPLHQMADHGNHKRRGNDVTFHHAQPIDILYNEAFYNSTSGALAGVGPDTFHVMHQTVLDAIKMKHALETMVRDESQSNHLSRLQRSYHSKRFLDVEESTRNIYPNLLAIANALLSWTANFARETSTDYAIIFNVPALRMIWWRLFSLVHQEEFDLSLYNVASSHGQQIAAGISKDSSSSSELQANVEGAFLSLNANNSGSGPLILDRIWNTSQMLIIPNFRNFEALLNLESVAHKFEDFCWQTDLPISEVLAVWKALLRSMESTYSQYTDFEVVSESIERAMHQMNTDRTIRSPKPLEPLLKQVFEVLYRHIDCASLNAASYSGDGDEQIRMAYFARRSINTILRPSLSGTASTTLEKLISLGRYADRHMLSVLEARSLDGPLLCCIRDINSTALSHVELLSIELENFGHTLANTTEVLSTTRVWDTVLLVKAYLSETLDILVQEPPAILEHEISLMNNTLTGLDTLFHENHRLQDITIALTRVAAFYVARYFPDHEYDPATKQQFRHDLYTQHLRSLQQQLQAFAGLDDFLTGSTSSLRRQVIMTQITKLGSPPKMRNVLRPQESELSSLIFDASTIVRAIRPLMDEDFFIKPDSNRLETILQSVALMIERLSRVYRIYEDLTKPLIGFLSCLKICLRLLLDLAGKTYSSLQNYIAKSTPFMMALPGSWIQLQVSSLSAQVTDENRFALYYLRLISHWRLIGPWETWPPAIRELTNRLLASVQYRWKQSLSIEQKKLQESSSIYRYTGADADVEPTDSELNELFPEEASGKPSDYDGSNMQNSLPEVGKLYLNIFEGQKPSEQSFTHNLEQSFNLMSTMELDGEPAIGTLPNSATLPAIFRIVERISSQHNENNKVDGGFNIYKDSCIREMKKLKLLLEKLTDWLHPTLEAWPENSVLHNIDSASQVLLDSEHSLPLMSILPSIELLYSRVAEWQSVTSQQYNASAVFDELTNLIISWRQLELSTWARLLDDEDRKHADAAYSWWFTAYENTLLFPSQLPADGFDNHSVDLSRTIYAFLQNSTLGQFHSRLRIVSALSNHSIYLIPNALVGDTVQKTLANTFRYFERYKVPVQEKITSKRKDLESSIKKTIQLASWSDRNVLSLKEGAKKSHRKLFNLVRKYRKHLEQPVATVLNSHLPYITKPLTHDPSTQQEGKIFGEMVENAILVKQQDPEGWASRPKRYQQIRQTTIALRSRLLRDRSVLLDSPSILQQFVSDLLSSAQSLQKSTPAMLTDDNGDFVKHLSTRKRKLLADTLRELRTHGFRSNLSTDLLSQQDEIQKITHRLPMLSGENHGRYDSWSDTGLMHVLDLITEIRAFGKSHHEDLNPADVSKSISYAESILCMLLEQRQSLVQTANRLDVLNHLLEPTRVAIRQENITIIAPDLSWKMLESRVKAGLDWLPPIINTAIETLEAQARIQGLHFENPLQWLRTSAHELTLSRDTLNQSPAIAPGIWTANRVKAIESAKRQIEEVFTQAREKTSAYPQAGVILRQVVQWAELEAYPTVEQANVTNGFLETQSEQQLFDALDLVLGATQDVEECLKLLPQNTDQAKWLSQENNVQQAILKSFHVPVVTEALQTVFDGLHRNGGSENKLQDTFTSLVAAWPILQQYHEAIAESIKEFGRLHHAMCEMAYHLLKLFSRLAQDGFCKPSEKSKGQQASSEKLESGTGLGEGEGSDDISKDVDDDEDLSEIAQQPEQQENSGDTKPEDDAVDIEGGLKGANGQDMPEEEHENEAPEKPDDVDEDEEATGGDASDMEDGGQASGEDAVDDQVGDVDDLGPSAVDEKLWDEPADVDKTQISKSQPAGKKNQDEQAASGDIQEEPEQSREDDKTVNDSENDDSDGHSDTSSFDSFISDKPPQDDGPSMDPHLKESEALELPDDLQLDGPQEQHLQQDDDGSDNAMLDELDLPKEETIDDKSNENSDETQNSDENQEKKAGQNEDKSAQEGDEIAPDEIDDSQKDDYKDGGSNSLDIERNAEGDDSSNNAPKEDTEATEAQSNAQADGGEEMLEEQTTSASSAVRNTGTESKQRAQATSAEQDSTLGKDSRETTERARRDLEILRQLGSTLEKWHRQNQEIREADPEAARETGLEQQDVDMAGAEFEHLNDEQDQGDTQALGASTYEQSKPLDERMAIAPENPETSDKPKEDQDLPENTETKDEDVDMLDAPPADPDLDTSLAADQPHASIGQPSETATRLPDPLDHVDGPSSPSLSSVSSIEDNISTLALLDSAPPPLVSSSASMRWRQHESRTSHSSSILASHLRLILAPTISTKLRGDFRTGKRLNIKRIIPYIASGYRRDKIWMRRSAPTKRAYQILLAIDDSRSMDEGGVAALAFDTLALVARALSTLEAGELGVLGFGKDVMIAHELGDVFAADAGAKVLSKFAFNQDRTDVKVLVRKSIDLFKEARGKASAVGSAAADLWQLQLIVSDGICEDHEGIRKLLLEAQRERIMMVFVIVDAQGQGQKQNQGQMDQGDSQTREKQVQSQSVLDLETVEFVQEQDADGKADGPPRLVRRMYLDTFPFKYYLVVRDVKELPNVLAAALRQWFAEVAAQ